MFSVTGHVLANGYPHAMHERLSDSVAPMWPSVGTYASCGLVVRRQRGAAPEGQFVTRSGDVRGSNSHRAFC